MDKFLSLEEASVFMRDKGIDLKPSTLRKKAQGKQIPCYRIGKLMFKAADLDSYIESKRIAANRWPGRGR